jgi:periplasmic copper chaperone A
MPAIRLVALGAVAALALVAAPSAHAHGTLTPTSATAGTVQEFALTVPNDRGDADLVAVTLELPEDVALESATSVQPLWAVSSTETSVTWQGGPIDRGSSETFSFSARLPSDDGQLEFVLRETYDDGQAAPFPLVVTTEAAAGGGGDSSGTLAVLALVVAIAAALLAGAALVVALRS